MTTTTQVAPNSGAANLYACQGGTTEEPRQEAEADDDLPEGMRGNLDRRQEPEDDDDDDHGGGTTTTTTTGR